MTEETKPQETKKIEVEKTFEKLPKVEKTTANKEVIKVKPAPIDKEKVKQVEENIVQGKDSETNLGNGDSKHKEIKTAEEKKKTKKIEQKLIKKDEAVAYGKSVSISRKHAKYICRFIKNKSIDKAISDLNLVILYKKSIPFIGEIPHRKGPGMSGRYPINAAKHFVTILKGLKGNVIVNQMELEITKISIASSSWASRPARRGGMSGKRTNIILRAREIKRPKEEKNNG